MRINDYRNDYPTPAVLADMELGRLAELITWSVGSFMDTQHYHQRNRDRFPNEFGNRPGAMVAEHCTPAQREILKHLESSGHTLRVESIMLDSVGVNRNGIYTRDYPFARPTNWRFRAKDRFQK